MKPDWLTALKTSPVAAINTHLFDSAKLRRERKPRKDCKQVIWLKEQLTWWCKMKGYELKSEFKFHNFRKFKFDFAIEELKVAVEYEGINSKKSGHTTITGYTKDTDKYNLAASMGWKVLRFTVLNYETIIYQLEQNTPK